jgi:hypothetical protein
MQYEQQIIQELKDWRRKMLRKPSVTSKMAAAVQGKINSIIPKKVHNAITAAIKNMIRAVLFGATYTTSKPLANTSLEEREALVDAKIENYKKTGAAEGGITGAGGFFTSLADFPILLGIKIKMLFDIAALYGFDVKDYRERLYMLYIFQLAFSSDEERKKVYLQIEDWDEKLHQLPADIHEFDWQTFQQQYRDYIDIAKLAQLIPFIGAAVGAIANYKLIQKLGFTAKQAYRMRFINKDIYRVSAG